jgi:archaellum biogenesis ATPase FlaH
MLAGPQYGDGLNTKNSPSLLNWGYTHPDGAYWIWKLGSKSKRLGGKMKKATPTEMKSRSSESSHIISNDKTSRFLADKNELEIFFRALFQNANSGYISLRGFKSDNTPAFKPESYLFDDRQLLISSERLANFTVSLPKAVFCTPSSTFKVPDRATEKVIANGIAITVDFDNVDPQKSREILEDIFGPATLVIASGGQWQDNQTGNFKPKLHMHWRLTNPTKTQKDHERLKQVRKRAAQISSGDLSASSPAHPMRVPGSWHTKVEPKLCRILECREEVQISLEFAEAALGLKCSSKSLSKPLSLNDGHRNPQNTNFGLAALENESLELSLTLEGSRNNCLNKAAFCLGQLIIDGELDQSTVFSRLLIVAMEIGLSESEARSTISNGMKKGMANPRNHQNGKRVDTASLSRPVNCGSPRLRTGAEIRNLNIKIEWLIDGIIPKNAVTLFFGRGGIGKTTLAMQMCNAIASGQNFLGKDTQKTTVIYVDYENSLPVLSDRLKTVGADDVLFWSSADDPRKLDQQSGVYLNLLRQNPNCLFVFDTLRSAQDGDENDSRFMAGVMKSVRKLRDHDATIVLLHHTKKSEDEVYKGSTAIFDLVDHVLGLYPFKKGMSDQESDDEIPKNSGAIFFFGTKDKTRFMPSKNYLRFDNDRRLFMLADDPQIDHLLKIQRMIPETGIIQTNLLVKIDSELGLKKGRALKLLEAGINQYWSSEKNPKNNNAITYKPVSGFLNPIEKEKPETAKE